MSDLRDDISNAVDTVTANDKIADGPTHQIINTRTGQVVGTANSVNSAYRMVDRLDNAYGASIHAVRPIIPTAG